VLGLSNAELRKVYLDWNQGELDSYLIEITAHIFTRKDDETGQDLVDVILDRAAQKGTGKWTSQNALDLGVPLPLITESVFARVLSSLKDQRVAASKILSGPPAKKFSGDRDKFIEAVRCALYLSKVISYAQGFAQLRAAAEEYKWQLDYGTIASIFRAGCIIRARFLQKITDAYATDGALANLLLDPYFHDIAQKYQAALREVVGTAVSAGVPVPAFSSAIAYYDGYRAERLPANLIQAQRDFFGAHTFERIDKKGSFHADWS
jgi:6-phosphogluconate dehydrogenase